MTTADFGFSVLDLGTDDQVAGNLKQLLADNYKIEVTAVMNNGNLQAVITPGVTDVNAR